MIATLTSPKIIYYSDLTCSSLATWNNARTIFSPSPTYLLVSVAADIEKNVAEHSAATHLASNVLPADKIILFSIEVIMLEHTPK